MAKAKRYQIEIVRDTYQQLFAILQREANAYILKMCDEVLAKKELSSPIDDQFFRDLAFEAYFRVTRRELDHTESTSQAWKNMEEVKRILGGE